MTMVELKNSGAHSCANLLEAYRKSENKPHGAMKIPFAIMNGRDIYNITAPFEDDGESVIAGRVEQRDSEASEIHFFIQRNGSWVPRVEPVFALQDPFYTRISGELVFGGVQTFPHPQHDGALSWRTVFYKGSSIAELQPLFQGPDQMKDLRLVQLADGKIGVFTRPQGEKGGRGKIGYTQVNSLEDLSLDLVSQAPLLDQFLEEEWGGCNEIHLLANGLLGVLGHIARFDEQGDRYYYPMIFVYNPKNQTYSDIEIIAERSDFMEGPSKRSDLKDVVFSGGLIRRPDGTADLYAGISDVEAHQITVKDPFVVFETL